MAQLNEALLETKDSGLWLVNFFNGKLLSAEDLSREQQARELLDRRLGQAVGEGVVRGLEVQIADAAKLRLNVLAGLAINRRGRPLYLEADTRLDLTLPPAQPGPVTSFKECDPRPTLGSSLDPGAYLLTLYPAEEGKERAEVSGLGNAVAPCHVRFMAQGVQFRLIPLATALSGYGNPPGNPKLQNWLAYRCFGLGEAEYPANRLLNLTFSTALPAEDGPDYGLLKKLRPKDLTDCDVPLAVLHIAQGQGLRFVDLWAVRRKPHRRLSARWQPLLGERRQAEGEAIFYQFQDQVAAMLSPNKDLGQTVASSLFEYLPPVGLLPVGGNRFQAHQFFKEGPSADDGLEPAQIRQAVQQALALEPVEVKSWIEKKFPLIRLFALRGISQYILFVRDDRLIATQIPSDPPTSVEPGRFLIGLVDEESQPLDPKAVKRVWATDKAGKQYLAQPLQVSLDDFDLGSVVVLGNRSKKTAQKASTGGGKIPHEFTVYLIEEVPPGTYYLKAQASGYRIASETASLSANQQVEAVLRLYAKDPAHKPGGSVHLTPGHELVDPKGHLYGRISFPDKYPIVDREKEFPWKDPGYVDPPPDERETIEDLLQDQLERDPEAPFTARVDKLAFQPDYDPGTVSEDPYAYVLTEDGSALATLLTPSEQALPGAVSTSASGVPELSSGSYASVLSQSGLGQMDVFAGAWAGLVAETLGVSPAMAKSLIQDVGTAATQAKNDKTYYAGLDKAGAQKLKDKGFDSDVKLANASVREVQAALGEGYSSGFAARIVEQARSLVSASAWSLSEAANQVRLGLSDEQLGEAARMGLDSLGALERALETDAAGLRQKLGLSEVSLTRLGERVSSQLQTARVASSGETPLTALPSLDHNLAATLVEAGITGASTLAETPAKDLALTLGISQAVAEAIVKEAITATLTRKGGLSQSEAARLVKTTGATRLSDLADVAKVKTGRLSADKAATIRAIGELAGRGWIGG